MLAQIGWDAGQRLQDIVYARMDPIKKMRIAFQWREAQVEMLRRQLAAENPGAAPERLRALLLQRLDWARAPREPQHRSPAPAAPFDPPAAGGAGPNTGRPLLSGEAAAAGAGAVEDPQMDSLAWVIGVLERMQVPYVLAGSMALIVWATPRTTHDIDLLVDLPPERIDEFCANFPPTRFSVDPAARRAAFTQPGRSLSNIIDMDSGFKIDLSPIRPADPLHLRALEHAVRRELRPGLTAAVASPEDLLLQKLEWYTFGQSERQFRDCLALLQAAQTRAHDEINWATIDAWIQRLGPQMAEAWARLKAACAETQAAAAPDAEPGTPPT